jgi:hypothetical protein
VLCVARSCCLLQLQLTAKNKVTEGHMHFSKGINHRGCTLNLDTSHARVRPRPSPSDTDIEHRTSPIPHHHQPPAHTHMPMPISHSTPTPPAHAALGLFFVSLYLFSFRFFLFHVPVRPQLYLCAYLLGYQKTPPLCVCVPRSCGIQ